MTHTPPSLHMLSVNGSSFVTPDGTPIRLRGVAAGGWLMMEDFISGHPGAEHTLRRTLREHLGPAKAEFFFERFLHHFFNEDDVAFIKSTGANVLRVPFNYRHFESDLAPFTYLERGFERLDTLLGWCEKHGLYVILDLHAVQGWQSARWHCDNANAVSLLWSHRHFQDRFVAFWQEMAHRYKNRAVVAAYEVCNEPVTNLPNGQDGQTYTPNWSVMNTLYRRVVEAIREVDTQHAIVLEGDERGRLFDGLEPPPDTNLVYSSHNYSRTPLAGLEGQSSGDRASSERQRQQQIFLAHEGTRYAAQHSVPLLVGEFGWQYNVPREHAAVRLRALEDQIEAFETSGVDWVMWTYKDLGAMGWVHPDPESGYMRLIKPILETKRAFRADFATKFLAPSAAQRGFQGLLQLIDDTNGTAFGHEAHFVGMTEQSLQNLVGTLLQPSYARLFKGRAEADIDDLLSAFALKNCAVQSEVLKVVRRHCGVPHHA